METTSSDRVEVIVSDDDAEDASCSTRAAPGAASPSDTDSDERLAGVEMVDLVNDLETAAGSGLGGNKRDRDDSAERSASPSTSSRSVRLKPDAAVAREPKGVESASDSEDRPSARRTAAGSETGTRRVLTTSKRMKCAGGARALGACLGVDVSNVNVVLSSSPGPARGRIDSTRRVHVDFASVRGRRPEPEAAPPRAAHTTARAPAAASTRAHGDIARRRAPSLRASAGRERGRQVF